MLHRFVVAKRSGGFLAYQLNLSYYALVEKHFHISRIEGLYILSLVGLPYNPCVIRGGARRSAVQWSRSLIYPPSPNYSLLGNAFVAGDCGPGAVVVAVSLMCSLFPEYFDRTKAPTYAVEVRCLLAVLLSDSTLFDSHFASDNSLYANPPHGSLFCGVLHRPYFYRNFATDSDRDAWRKRLALLVCPGEGTLIPDGRRCVDLRFIVWFTLDVVYTLVDYLLRHIFMGQPSDFDVWCAQHGPARHSQGPICYVPGAAPWCVPMGTEFPASPYDPYCICVLHVGTHFQVHVRRTLYIYGGITALTLPCTEDPGCYALQYLRSPRRYRIHVTDPMVFARPYVTRGDSSLPYPITGIDSTVTLPMRQIFSGERDATLHSATYVGIPVDTSRLPADVAGFRYVEPVEAMEQALVAQSVPVNAKGFGCIFGDFPVRLPAFDVLVHGPFPSLNSAQQVFAVQDANFDLACRTRSSLCDFSLNSVPWAATGDPERLEPVVALVADHRWVPLASGQSTVLGRGAGLFVFHEELQSHLTIYVVDRKVTLGWFVLQSLSADELLVVGDSSISELVFSDGPRYYYTNEILASIQCVWDVDDCFHNNCTWVAEGSYVGIQTDVSFVHCQECFLPFGWTYGPTRNQPPFVCYQIWQSQKAVILGSSSPFHHRLAWLLTTDFFDPSPRHLMRLAWGLPVVPPVEALVSVLSYRRWAESFSLSSPLDVRVTSRRELDSATVIPRKKLKSRQRRRIAAAIEQSSVFPLESVSLSQSPLAKRERELSQDSLPTIEAVNYILLNGEAKRQKSSRRAWKRWRGRYVTVQQQMWMALQVLAAEPSELHFSHQLREIAVEFSSTPDCSDSSEYIAQQRAEGKLLQFDFARLQVDEAGLLAQGLDAFIESRFVKFPGLGFHDLWQFMKERSLCASKHEKLFELLDFGQDAFMLDTFTPNGCSKSVKNGAGYDSHRALCEHTAAKLYLESRCILVREELLFSHYMCKGLHISPCNTVHKEGAVKRVVTDLSHGKDKFSSYNHSVDLEKHLEAYPRNPLPTLRHVATLACQMRREHIGAGLLHGGVVDVRTAYQQYRLSLAKAKLVCTRLFTRRQVNGLHQDVAVIMIALTGTFGDVGAGDTYAILGDVFHELHNAVWALWRSVTYVDDMLILAPPFPAKPHPFQLQHPFHECDGVCGEIAEGAPPVLKGSQFVIHQAVTYARNLIGNVLGAQATEPRKSKWFYGCLIGIGWYFNLIYSEFYVLPKPEKLRKIVHYLFNVVPVGSEVAPFTAVRELQGLLCWFSAALPLGKSFVYSLFRCRPGRDGVVSFSAVAIRDLDFWRSLARCAMIYPNLFGTKLENLEFGRRPTWFVRTDASTGHGGGGWLSRSATWVPGAPDARCFALRWTSDELAYINMWVKRIPRPTTEDDLVLLQENLHHYCSDSTVPKSIRDLGPLPSTVAPPQDGDGSSLIPALDINVLEFATAVFAMVLWAPLMQGSCVCIGADNTATLCWLVKHKTTNVASDVILKLLSLTCAVYNIQLVTEFIPGVRNVLADWLSRVSGGDRWDFAQEAAKFCGGSQGFFRENLNMMAKDPESFPRRLISRTILMRSLTVSEPVAFQTLLAIILALKGVDDLSCDIGDVEVKCILNGIATALLSSTDGTLVVSTDYESAFLQYGDRYGDCGDRHSTVPGEDSSDGRTTFPFADRGDGQLDLPVAEGYDGHSAFLVADGNVGQSAFLVAEGSDGHSVLLAAKGSDDHSAFLTAEGSEENSAFLVAEGSVGHSAFLAAEGFNVHSTSSDATYSARVLLPRKSKTKAIEAIRKTIRESPSGAYRIPQIKDLPGVQVSIAPSGLRGAGLGLFLTRGPASDGSAPKGTRLATYEGFCFVNSTDIASVESSTHLSDYLWGKLNPLTRVYTIVDAADPKSCYSRYVNEGFFDSNCEVVLGTDDVLYLVATTDIAPNEECTMPYGATYWTLPERWVSLTPFLREAVLQFYDCAPPDVPAHAVDRARFGFGPEYSSDNAADGPHERSLRSGWGTRKAVGKGWDSILSDDTLSPANARERLQASFPLLQSQAMASCHAPSTLRSYGSGWRSWLRFCEFFGSNPMCDCALLAPLPFHVIIRQIQDYIHFECAVRQIQPDSIKNVYLAGIADYFDRLGVINRFREASNHNCVQLLLNSYSRSWKKKHPDSSKVKIAFGLSFAGHAERLILSGTLAVGGYICSDKTDLVSYMVGVRVVTALWLGIFFLLRKNEFLSHSADPNGMQEPCRRRNLRFFDVHRVEIPYERIGLQQAASVSLNLRFSKTDQTGHGRIVQHESTDDPNICVVRRLEEYIRVSRDYFHAAVDSILFSVPGLPSDLSSAVLTAVMRDTTTALGLPAKLISAHSLRYGGATALSQAGFPEYIVAFYGGWVNGSVAMRRYIGQTAQTRRMVSSHMAKTAYASSVEDLVRETLAGRDPDVPIPNTSVIAASDMGVIMGPAYAALSRKRSRKN